MMTTYVPPPQENLSYSALRHFSATSSYFSHFFGGKCSNIDAAAKIHEEAKRLLADHPNLSKSLFTPNRSFLDYLPFINPFIRGFNPNLLHNEGNNTTLPAGEKQLHSYKTVMCEAWLLTAFCGYGNSCRFAHGLRELRLQTIINGVGGGGIENTPKKDSPKYQTKFCVKYTTVGICCHGPACLFLHPLPDDPKLFLAPLLASENVAVRVPPPNPPAPAPLPPAVPTGEYYMMSQSFYLDNHYFKDPYYENAATAQAGKIPDKPVVATPVIQTNSSDVKTKLLDFNFNDAVIVVTTTVSTNYYKVFDENGQIIEPFVTPKPATSDKYI